MPALSLETLQQMQSQDLCIMPPSESDTEYLGKSLGTSGAPLFDLSLLRTRLDSIDKGPVADDVARELPNMSMLACVRSRLDSADAAALEESVFVYGEELGWACSPSSLDPTLTREAVAEEVDPPDESVDHEEGEEEKAKRGRALAFLDAAAKHRKIRSRLSRYNSHLTKDDMASVLYSPPDLVLGTNPPDFSSPLMMAAIRVENKRAKYQTM
jgi:hypothetical protein